MTTLEEQYAEQVGALIGIVTAENASLKVGIAQKDAALQAALEALNQERADRDALVANQVRAALDADSAADADRMKVYLDQLKAAVPADVPDVPVPDPGVPATPPPDSGVEIPVEPPSDGGSAA